MSDYRAAFRYAKSLLSLSIEQDSLEAVYHDMVNVDGLIDQNREFALFLRSPIIKHQRKMVIIQLLFSGRLHKLTASFLQLLASKGRAAILYAVVKEFERLYLETKGIQKAIVTTTFRLTDDLKKEFERLIGQVSKKDPLLTEKVDDAILGGFILDVGDRRIDSSMRSKLRKISYELAP